MKRPVLVIMAAGMGSRYGGLKQIDPIDREGHIIIDFSIYDARRAGFEKVVFIIKKDNEEEFKEKIATISENAVGDACTGSNPRTIDPATMERLFTCIYYGTEVDF